MSNNSAFFRAGVGAIITSSSLDQVLLFQRGDYPDNWQCPQGGIQSGEAVFDALFREIFEETGIQKNELTVVAEHPLWLGYDLSSLDKHRDSQFFGLGQVHKWYILTLSTSYDEFRQSSDGEFVNSRWSDIRDLTSLSPFFKKEISLFLVDWFCATVGGLKEISI